MSEASDAPVRDVHCVRRHAENGEIEALSFLENGRLSTKSSDEVVADLEGHVASYVLRNGLRFAALRVDRSNGTPVLVTALDGTPRRLHELPECE